MTLAPTFLRGARVALDLAELWERGANEHDDAWRARSLAEAKKHRRIHKTYLRWYRGELRRLRESEREEAA